jgi:phospholipid/cholesterol/gamma-HCH transport system substrate-binding protein
MPSVRRDRLVTWAKFRVSVVTIVAALILMVLLYLLSGSTLLRPQAHLYMYIPDATGIAPGSSVEVNGIPIGEVTGVQLTGSNQPDRVVRVTLDVLAERLTTITEDSYAQVDSESLLGDKVISITSGQSPRLVRSGSELRFRPQQDLMKSLDVTQFEAQLRTVDALITDIETGKSDVGKFVLGDQMYNDINRRVEEIEKAVHIAANTTGSLGEALYTDKLYRRISDPIARLDQTLAQLQSGQGSGGALLHDTAQFDSLHKDIEDLRKQIADLRTGPLLTSDEAYTGMLRMLTAWIQNANDMNATPMFNTSEAYESMIGATRELETSMKEFRVDPRKFLRLKVF